MPSPSSGLSPNASPSRATKYRVLCAWTGLRQDTTTGQVSVSLGVDTLDIITDVASYTTSHSGSHIERNVEPIFSRAISSRQVLRPIK